MSEIGQLSNAFSLALLVCFIVGTLTSDAAFVPPIYKVEAIPTGKTKPSGYQIFFHTLTDQLLIGRVGETKENKFCSVKNGIRSYFAGSDAPYEDEALQAGFAGRATSALFTSPLGVWADTTNNIFVSDSDRGVRKVTPNGMISNFAGYGSVAGSGDGGPATSASMVGAGMLHGDTDGNVFISELHFYRVRKVSKSGIISTVAGGGEISTDGAPATSSNIGTPTSVFVNTNGDLFFVSHSHKKVYMVEKASQTLTTISGGGANFVAVGGSPSLSITIENACGIWGDDRGNIYYTDVAWNSVQMIAKETNYQTTYLVSNNLAGPFSGTIDNPTGRMFILQGDGLLKMLTDPLYLPLEVTSAPEIETSSPSALPVALPSTAPSFAATATPTVTPSDKLTTELSVATSSVPTMAPSLAVPEYTITLTAKTFKYFEVRVYTHNNLRILPVSYELEHCPENAGFVVWYEQTTEDTNTCVYGYPRNFWCECAAVADAKPKLVLHMGHTVFDRVELLLLNWEDGEVTVTDEANHETFLSATHDGVGKEFVTFDNLHLEHIVTAPARRLLRGA